MTLKEPVYVHFTVHNGSLGPIRLDLGANWNSKFEFAIIDPHGRLHRRGPLKPPPFSALGTAQVNAGESFGLDLLLNQWYQFTVPGPYKIEPSLSSEIVGKPGTPVDGASGVVLALGVQPRDPGRLQKVCARLAAAASSPESGAALQPARALSYVVDPVAVPYLAKVAEQGEPLRTIALDGLARIAELEGLQAVSRQLRPGQTHLRPAIAQAFYSMQRGVKQAD